MKALLVRVGADQGPMGGEWNGPVDSDNGRFSYVPIPETKRVHSHLKRPYASIASSVADFGCVLPSHLASENMHLDPDFVNLTYGDSGQRAKQIRDKIRRGDLLVFYAGLRDVRGADRLVYAIIGLYRIKDVLDASSIPREQHDINAHTRRLRPEDDIVVRASPNGSGRLERCIPIGEYRDNAYRVRSKLLKVWGGLAVRNGYIQRSVYLPEFLDAPRFYDWFRRQNIPLLRRNN